jgi:hypothetical protein
MKVYILKYLMLLLFAANVYAIDVKIPDTNFPAEKSFVVGIQTSDLSGQNIFSVDMKIIFDASILSATSVNSSGTLLNSWGNPTSNISSDNVRISAGGTSALGGSGTLVKIRFKVANNAVVGSSSPIAFASFQFNESSPGANLVNGTFTVIQDTEPPVITSGPTAGSITSHSTIITWRTNEPGNSIVEYGTSASYGETLSSDQLVTNHSFSIGGLQASTTYHYRVSTTDNIGNGPTFSPNQTFRTSDIIASLPDEALDPGTTFSIPVSISDLSEQDVKSVDIVIQFDSNILSASAVATEGTIAAGWQAPTFSASPGRIQVSMAGPTPLNGSGILLNILFQVSENVHVGSQSTLAFSNFQLNNGIPPVVTRNGSFLVKDTQPPIITYGPEISNTSSNSADILWTTNELSNSRVAFGKTTSFGNVEFSSKRTLDHKISLSGLDPETMYHVRVSSSDSSGNGPIISENAVFTTQPGGSLIIQIPDRSTIVGEIVTIPVQASNLSGTGILSYFAVFKYDRDLLEFQRVENGPLSSGWTNLFQDVVDGQILVSNSGGLELSGQGALFNLVFKIKTTIYNTDTEIGPARFMFNAGWPETTTRSGTISISGNPDTQPPAFTFGPIVDQISTNSSRIIWSTNEPSNAKVNWGQTTSYGEIVNKPEYSTFFTVELSGLVASTNYNLRVNSYDQAGNGPQSSQNIFFQTKSHNGVAVTLPDVLPSAGSNFQLSIDSGNLSGLNVYSAYIILSFDETILTATSATSSGTLTQGWGNPVYTITPGRTVIAMGGVSALRNAGSLVKINFSVASTAKEGTQIPISFENFTFNEGTPSAELTTGMVTIQDITDPIIEKGPIAFGITPNSASILWATNEPTTARIEYGQTRNYGEEKQNEQLSTGHMLVLSGLEPNTEYYYKVSSKDVAGNGPVLSGNLAFSTAGERLFSLALPIVSESPGSLLDVPVDISDVTGMGINTIDFNIQFDDQILVVNKIKTIGTLTESWNSPQFNSSGGTLTVSLNGPAVLSGSGNLAIVQFNVLENATIGSQSVLQLSNIKINNLDRDVTVTNGLVTVKDDTPPQIINGPFPSAITSHSAEIVWFTDEPANSQVNYGVTPDYGEAISDSRFVTEHRANLSDLSSNTTLNFNVASTDSFGNGPTTSENKQFTTLGLGNSISLLLPDTTLAESEAFLIPIRLQNQQSENVTAVNFEIFYDNNVLDLTGLSVGNSLVQNWSDLYFSRKEASLKVDLSGSVPISTSGVLLYISGKIKTRALPGFSSSLILADLSANSGQLPAVGTNGQIRIVDKTPPEFVQIPKIADTLFNSATIFWETNEPSTGYIEYGLSESYEKKLRSDSLALYHRVTLPNLTASSQYFFRAGIVDSSFNGPTISAEQSFTTPSGELYLSMPDSIGSPNQNMILPIKINRMDGHDITKIELSIQYDANVIITKGVSSQNTITTSWQQPSFSDAGGVVQLTLQGENALTNKGPLIYLSIQISPTAPVGVSTNIVITKAIANDGAVEISAIESGALWIEAGDPETAIMVSVPDTSAIVGTSISLPILVDSLDNRGIFSFRFKLNYSPTLVSVVGIDTVNTLVNGWVVSDVIISESAISCEMAGGRALEKVGVLVYINVEILNSSAEKNAPFEFDYFTFNQGYPPALTKNGSISIKPRKDIIAGFVLEKDTSSPIDSAIVTIAPGDNIIFSDSTGFFQFSNLDSLLSYNLSVSKSGFESYLSTTQILPGTNNLSILLNAKNGFLKGTVLNQQSGPIAKALIIVDDTFGNFGSANSDSSGFFNIDKLAKSNPYTVRVSKFGYFDKIVENVPINSNLNILLKDDFGEISGTVTLADNAPAANVTLQLANINRPQELKSTFSNNAGDYNFNKVVAGDYVLVVQQAGFMSSPEEHTITLGPGQKAIANFNIEAAILYSLSLQIDEELPNNKDSNIFYLALTESGRKMSISNPVWSVQPGKAGVVTNGTFLPNELFLGTATFTITDRATLFSDTSFADIYAAVGPETNAIYSNESEINITVPAGAFRKPQKLKLSTVSLPPFKQNAKSATALGDGIQIKPNDYILDLPIMIKVPYQTTSINPGLTLGRWDKENANWLAAQNIYYDDMNNSISASISTLGLFSVLVQSRPLGIETIKYYPNPFSPDVDTDNDGEPGLSILLKMSSTSSRTPFVTIKIYNMLGELVKTLAERQPFIKDTDNVIRWNGQTNDNRLARNGRYIVRTEIEDANGTTENVATVVLIR